MAFLCNEEKFFKTKNLPSTEQIGPGYYISQSVKRNIKKSYKPFGSGVCKNIKPNICNIPLNHSKNIYLFNPNDKLKFRNTANNFFRYKITDLREKDDIPKEDVNKDFIIVSKSSKKFKNTLPKKKREFIELVEYKPINNNQKNVINSYIQKTPCITNDNNEQSEETSKTENEEKKLPEKNKKQKKINDSLPKLNMFGKVRTKYNCQLLLDLERDKNLHENAFISSIPFKEQSFGYMIDDNGKMTPKENPDALKIFTGLGKDTVGPGNYEINMKWNKTMPLWSKSRTSRFSSEDIKHKITNKKNFENDMKEKDKLIFYKTCYSTSENWLNKVKNNNIYKSNFKISLAEAKEQLLSPSGKVIKNNFDKPGRTDKFFINKLNVLYPGPGYYYEDDKWSCLKIIRLPCKKKKKFNFGSNVDRFPFSLDDDENEETKLKFEDPKEAYRKKLKEIKNKSPLPTTYFKEDLKKQRMLREKFKCPQKTFYFQHYGMNSQ